MSKILPSMLLKSVAVSFYIKNSELMEICICFFIAYFISYMIYRV